MKIAIDSDNNGKDLKEVLIRFLKENQVDIKNLDFLSTNTDKDYPDVAENLAQKIASGNFDRGILICGTGQGMAMTANKIPGIFAGACNDVYSAERLVKSNNAQVICLGALVTGPELAKTIILAWMKSDFQGGRSLPKVQRMIEIDKKHLH